MHRCMADLLSKLNSGRRSQRGIRQYLRTAKVSDNINKLRQRVQAVQDSFLVRDSYHIIVHSLMTADPYDNHDTFSSL